jgi:hypothetical protein
MNSATILASAYATLTSATDLGGTIEVIGTFDDGRPYLVDWGREEFDAFIRSYGDLPTQVTVYTIEVGGKKFEGVAARQAS